MSRKKPTKSIPTTSSYIHEDYSTLSLVLETGHSHLSQRLSLYLLWVLSHQSEVRLSRVVYKFLQVKDRNQMKYAMKQIEESPLFEVERYENARPTIRRKK